MERPYEIYELYKLGEIPPEEMPSKAIELISSGIENDSLVIMAGLTSPQQPEIDELVETALEVIASEELNDERMISKLISNYEANRFNNNFDIFQMFRCFIRIRDRNPNRWNGLDEIVLLAETIIKRRWQAGDWESLEYCVEELKENVKIKPAPNKL